MGPETDIGADGADVRNEIIARLQDTVRQFSAGRSIGSPPSQPERGFARGGEPTFLEKDANRFLSEDPDATIVSFFRDFLNRRYGISELADTPERFDFILDDIATFHGTLNTAEIDRALHSDLAMLLKIMLPEWEQAVARRFSLSTFVETYRAELKERYEDWAPLIDLVLDVDSDLLGDGGLAPLQTVFSAIKALPSAQKSVLTGALDGLSLPGSPEGERDLKSLSALLKNDGAVEDAASRVALLTSLEPITTEVITYLRAIRLAEGIVLVEQFMKPRTGAGPGQLECLPGSTEREFQILGPGGWRTFD